MASRVGRVLTSEAGLLQIALERDAVTLSWERAALAGTAINVGAVGGAIALGAAAVCLIFHFLRMVDDQVQLTDL